uniref:Uncharacterized protein n=1 Tax=Meloidogyne hapla TaxID=6305 RepID=A0A1I8BL34_MELHA
MCRQNNLIVAKSIEEKEINIEKNNNKNKHVMITGGNQGIGLQTALLLASKGCYDITIACRNQKRAETALKQLKDKAEKYNNFKSKFSWLSLDLACLKNVETLVERIKKEKIIFDIIILNAGILLPKEKITKDGFETTFQVNFLGHFLLVDGIVNHQCPQYPLRIITLTSVIHRFVGNIFPLKKNIEKWPEMFQNAKGWKAYALSKFATAILAQHLNTSFGSSVKAFAVHPGAVRTQMAENFGHKKTRKMLFFLRHLLIEPDVAAKNVLFCVDNNLKNGQYKHADCIKKFPAVVRKQKNIEGLVKTSRILIEKFRAGNMEKM